MSKYEVVRHTVCGDREIENMDYFNSKKEAEEMAADLTRIYRGEDFVGHPWAGDRFYVVEISKEEIARRERSYAASRAFMEMGGEY